MKQVEIGHTSSVIIMNNEGKILLSKRKVTEGNGMYCLPGGKCEKGEKATKAAERELKEELDLNVQALKYLETRKKRLSRIWKITLFFTIVDDRLSKKIKNLEPNKVENLQWFDVENLPENTWEHNKQYIIENLPRIQKILEKSEMINKERN